MLDIEKTLAFDLRATWQCRVLSHASGLTGAVILSVLAHTYDEALPTLLRVVFPGFTSIKAPFLCSAAKVAKTGAIVADVVTADGRIIKDQVLYIDEEALRNEMRRLADRLKLNDTDRVELFKCVQRWVVADRRLDPTFDPQDPDAKRLVH